MSDLGEAMLAGIIAYDTDPMTLKIQGDPRRMPEGAVPAQDAKGSFFVPINQPSWEGGVTNSLQALKPEDLDIEITAGGTIAQGRLERRNEIVGLLRQGLIHPQLAREKLVMINVMGPQDLERQQQLEAEAMQAQAGQLPPGVQGGPDPGGTPSAEETFGDFTRQGAHEMRTE